MQKSSYLEVFRIKKVKNLSFFLGTALIFGGCGAITDHSNQSQLNAASETSEPSGSTFPSVRVEVYRGSEDGAYCELIVEKDDQDHIINMEYMSKSKKCDGSCVVDLGSKPGQADFTRAPSVQFPGFTRIARYNGVDSPGPFSVSSWDNFIVANDDFTTIRGVSRTVILIAGFPLVQNIDSECRNVQKVP
jgi:hypothetical protein